MIVSTTVSEQELSDEPHRSVDGSRAAESTVGESTVGELLDEAVDRHGPDLARVLLRCSILLDEVVVHGRATPVRDGQVLDVLPPFAGG